MVRSTRSLPSPLNRRLTSRPLSQSNDKFAFVLSSTLAEDGTPDDGTFDQARVAPFTLLTWCVLWHAN